MEEGETSVVYSIFGNFTIHVNFFDPTPTLDPPLDRTYTITHILNSDLFYYQNWCRVSLDESLWKALTFRRVGCRYACRDDVTWKSELKRLIYHAPIHLHQTCQEHHREINYICFSNSGNLIATCGEDGIVNVINTFVKFYYMKIKTSIQFPL